METTPALPSRAARRRSRYRRTAILQSRAATAGLIAVLRRGGWPGQDDDDGHWTDPLRGADNVAAGRNSAADAVGQSLAGSPDSSAALSAADAVVSAVGNVAALVVTLTDTIRAAGLSHSSSSRAGPEPHASPALLAHMAPPVPTATVLLPPPVAVPRQVDNVGVVLGAGPTATPGAVLTTSIQARATICRLSTEAMNLV